MMQWKSVYRTQDRIKAELVKDFLEENGLQPVIINKQDSAYVMLGEFEIHVSVDEVREALKLINDDLNIK